ncbi:MAG: hypothetical protein HQK65_16110, partial [Desulfamplus sp.]|nr:hypothetical protein [Desulfamplus sp.]
MNSTKTVRPEKDEQNGHPKGEDSGKNQPVFQNDDLSENNLFEPEERFIKSEKKEDTYGEITESYSLLHELMKGLAGICLLISLLVTLAMLADLYFNGSFQKLSNFFWSQTYKTQNDRTEKLSQQTVLN